MSVVLATGGMDHKICFWDAPTGRCTKMIKFPDSQVNKIEITPDKQFIAAAGNPVIRLYEISSSSSPSPAATVGGGSPSAGAPSNPAASPADPNHHHHHQQQPVLTLQGHTNNVTAVGFQKDGRYLYSCSEDGTIKVWDLRNPSYSRSFSAGSPVNSVCLRLDRDEFISGDQNGYVKVRK
jgi:G protein beta subunit-like protein